MNISETIVSLPPDLVVKETYPGVNIWYQNSLMWSLLTIFAMISRSKMPDTWKSTSEDAQKTKRNRKRSQMLSTLLVFGVLFDLSLEMHSYLSGFSAEVMLVAEKMAVGISVILAISVENPGRHFRKFLTVFWTCVLIRSCVLTFHQWSDAYNMGTSEFESSAYIVYTIVIVMKMVSDICDQDKPSDDEQVEKSLQEKASVFSKITFSWLNNMLRLGYKETLKNTDLPELKSGNKTENAFSQFHPHWLREFNKQKCEQQKVVSESESPKREGSVFKAILSAFGVSIFLSMSVDMIMNIVEFIHPIILKYLIQYVEEESKGMWIGIMYAASLFTLSVTRNIIGNQHGQFKHELEYKIKTSLLSTVYTKMLKMSNAARKSSTTGEIVNLMAVDAGRMCSMVHWIHHMWMGPIKVVISMFLLWTEVGVSAIAGFAATALFIPVHGYLSKKTTDCHLKLSETKDERVKLMNEVLNGVKVLKLYAWEKSFEEKILAIREKEMTLMRKIKIYDSISTLVWHIGPFLVSLSTFGLYVISDAANTLNAEKAFVSIAIFDILSWNMSVVPHVINGFTMGKVSMKRMKTFLNSEELDDDVIERCNDNAFAISVKDATFSWNKKENPILTNINLNIPEGSLVAIVGTIGAGKSSLLSAFLGEMEKMSGKVNIKGTTAYVSQQAWMQNATLKNNILFGKPFDSNIYGDIIDTCALKDDLDMLPGRDNAEIGEKGINLSGGQKQRVNMARAVYQDADIYLFDDPLSAVDSHVGKHIFNNVIGPNGSLKHKTRILVTHGISFLPKVDTIVTLKNGQVSEVGTYAELKTKSGAFAEFLKVYEKEGHSSDEDESENEDDTKTSNTASSKINTETTSSLDDDNDDNIGEETVETGKFKFRHFASYISNIGYILCVTTVLAFIVHQAADIFTRFWLTEWTNDSPHNISTCTSTYLNDSINDQSQDDQRYYRVGTYGIVGLSQALMSCVQALLMFLGGLSASRKLHQRMLRNVLSSPMSFFDTNPVGRIINRFSKDVEVLDWFSHELKGYCQCLSTLVTIPLVVGFTLPWFLVTIVPVVIIFLSIQKFHNPTTRQLKRLESANKSPIFTHFSESINGVSTIRAYQQQSRFESESRKKMDCYHKSLLTMINVHRWVGVRMDFLANLLTLFACVFAIMSKDILTTGVVAMCITYTMDTTHSLNWWMHTSLNMDEKLVSIERINEYMENPTEASWENEETKPSESWPQHGKVSFKDYQVRYREGLDLVLKGITCDINSGEKVGIVGRTGAGKSSLTMALFRMIESAGGDIVIDDVDISTIGLHDLRSKLTIIPQDPVLFSGSLRMNLDPFDHYSDKDVWKALDLAHLGQFVRSLPDKLQHKCTEGGENLSVGQRQLICLARALLKKTKVLVLDEATAAVDMETDDLIQETIRTEFSDCTILTIAHRLNTIMDYDRIMVLSKGKIQEFDTPRTLLSNADSAFYSMAKDANIV